MVLVREVIEPLSIIREYQCLEKSDREVIYRGPLRSHEKQEEVVHEVRGRYIAGRAMGVDGRVAMRKIAISMGLKLTRVQGIVRRARKDGLI